MSDPSDLSSFDPSSFDPSSFDPSRYERPLFFTGAGLSAESGIPTYRGRGGVWQQYDFESIACQEAFERDPEKVLDFHDWRRGMMHEAQPNAGHLAIARVQERLPGARVVTQNIDGLQQRAGSRNVIELHGSAWRVRCDREGKVMEVEEPILPSRRCTCGAWLRPDIVWFGDSLDPEVMEAAVDAVRACDLLVSVGTSGVVYPAAQLPHMAAASGATRIEVNPEETALSSLFDLQVREPAATALPRLFG